MKKRIEGVQDLFETRRLLLARLLEEKNVLMNSTTTLEKQTCVDNMNLIKQNITKIDNIVSRTATFETPVFANFVAALLTLTEKDQYSVVKISFSNKESKSNKEKTYYLVCEKEFGEMAYNLINSEEELVRLYNNINNEFLAIMSGKTTFPLDYRLKASPQYTRFPQIEKEIYHLIDLGIKNPNMEDEEKTSKILGNIVAENIRKSNGFKK